MKNEILVIDDNADIRFLICNILKDKDFLVRPAANFSQAVLEIEKKMPDLAIIDIKLDKPDFVVILPWNLKDEIINQLSGIRFL